jgi:hypothetical protein
VADITKQFDGVFVTKDDTTSKRRRLKTEDAQSMYNAASIASCSHPLSKLWRLVSYKLGITKKSFKEGLREYNLNIGKSEADTSIDWNNLQKSLFGDTMTTMTFQKLFLINKLKLKDIEITVENPNGTVVKYKLSEANEQK